MSNFVNWFSIQGKDVAALTNFYVKLFGWKVAPGPADMMFVPPPKGGIGGDISPSKTGGPMVSVYVSVKDVSEYLDNAVKAGAKPALDKTELPGNMGWIAGFIDPAGNFIGLWQEPKKAERKAAKKAQKAAKKAEKKVAAKKAEPAAKPAAAGAGAAAKKPAAAKPAAAKPAAAKPAAAKPAAKKK